MIIYYMMQSFHTQFVELHSSSVWQDCPIPTSAVQQCVMLLSLPGAGGPPGRLPVVSTIGGMIPART